MRIQIHQWLTNIKLARQMMLIFTTFENESFDPQNP